MRCNEHLINSDKIESWPCKINLRNTLPYLPYHISGHRPQGALWEDPDEESDNWQHVGDVSAGRHVQGTRSSRGDQVLSAIASHESWPGLHYLYFVSSKALNISTWSSTNRSLIVANSRELLKKRQWKEKLKESGHLVFEILEAVIKQEEVNW